MDVDADKLLASQPSGSRGDWLTEVLKQRIIVGHYKPGEWIREATLREQFGLSNGPVREALQNLVAVGVLVREVHRGVRVVSLSPEEVIELFELRCGIFELASELACLKVRPKDARRVRVIFEEIGEAVDRADNEEVFSTLSDIVDWVCETCGNSCVMASMTDLQLTTKIYIHASFQATADVMSLIDVWRTLVDAIIAGDVPAARTGVRQVYKKILDDLQLETQSVLWSSSGK